jgi:hypothetical protein
MVTTWLSPPSPCVTSARHSVRVFFSGVRTGLMPAVAAAATHGVVSCGFGVPAGECQCKPPPPGPKHTQTQHTHTHTCICQLGLLALHVAQTCSTGYSSMWPARHSMGAGQLAPCRSGDSSAHEAQLEDLHHSRPPDGRFSSANVVKSCLPSRCAAASFIAATSSCRSLGCCGLPRERAHHLSYTHHTFRACPRVARGCDTAGRQQGTGLVVVKGSRVDRPKGRRGTQPHSATHLHGIGHTCAELVTILLAAAAKVAVKACTHWQSSRCQAGLCAEVAPSC